jgi:uncharacterized protein (UPF0264 family)
VRLLVSVRDAGEACIAMMHGANVIDVKEPMRGALGAADARVVRAIRDAIGTGRTVSAVIGDALDVGLSFRRARDAVAAGCDLVKLGVADVARAQDARAIVGAAVDGAGGAPVAVVAYADADNARALAASALLDVTIESGASGFVMDTFEKRGGSLFRWVTIDAVRALVSRAATHGLFTGIAGGLGHADVDAARRTGVDLLGVRGAVCVGGREGTISGGRVRELVAACMPLERPA